MGSGSGSPALNAGIGGGLEGFPGAVAGAFGGVNLMPDNPFGGGKGGSGSSNYTPYSDPNMPSYMSNYNSALTQQNPQFFNTAFNGQANALTSQLGNINQQYGGMLAPGGAISGMGNSAQQQTNVANQLSGMNANSPEFQNYVNSQQSMLGYNQQQDTNSLQQNMARQGLSGTASDNALLNLNNSYNQQRTALAGTTGMQGLQYGQQNLTSAGNMYGGAGNTYGGKGSLGNSALGSQAGLASTAQQAQSGATQNTLNAASAGLTNQASPIALATGQESALNSAQMPQVPKGKGK